MHYGNCRGRAWCFIATVCLGVNANLSRSVINVDTVHCRCRSWRIFAHGINIAAPARPALSNKNVPTNNAPALAVRWLCGDAQNRKICRQRQQIAPSATVYRWCTVVSVWHWNTMNPRFSTEGHHISMSHERPCSICFVVWPTTSLKIIVYRLLRRWRNASEYRLPSKNAHRPNYCSWLAVCIN